ncbi:hypothetical protein [Chryseobacterium timonianum]|uniref:hypothetical protein n=1 Tax=Chryseobacterium timonianum TaxID=1805473 RepID=UPI001F4A1251|nr:hypothetical protein [Chryseobacterium timonianum]
MKNIIILCGAFLLLLTSNEVKSQSRKQKEVTIVYPKNNQKVRGAYKIYGGSEPNAVIKLTIISNYYKTNNNNGTKITKGEGPLKRLNRTYTLKSDRYGTWKIENIDLTNAGYEESFVIKASDGKKAQSIIVYDRTRPVLMD